MLEIHHYNGACIGDAFAALPVACGLADATGGGVTYHCKQFEWMIGLHHPNLTIVSSDRHAGANVFTDWDGECREADKNAGGSRCQWYALQVARQLGISPFMPVRPLIVRRPAPVFREGYVVLAPFANDTLRCWPEANWRELARLLLVNGRRVMAVAGWWQGAQLTELFAGLPVLCRAGDRTSAMRQIIIGAGAFVGNDSGLAHVAGAFDVPGVVVSTRHPHSWVYGEYPSLRGAGEFGRPLAEVPVAEVLLALDELPEAPAAERPTVDAVELARNKLEPRRAQTTAWLLSEVRRRFPDPRAVETGCIRQIEDWETGYMTYLLGALFDQMNGGQLVSVDHTPARAHLARELCWPWQRVRIVDGDSLAYMSDRKEPVDFAYLDSQDTDIPEFAEHHLREAQAVSRLMSSGGIIAFDDTPPTAPGQWWGKGSLAVPWLLANGWRVIWSAYQTVLERANGRA